LQQNSSHLIQGQFIRIKVTGIRDVSEAVFQFRGPFGYRHATKSDGFSYSVFDPLSAIAAPLVGTDGYSK
jgi:hypothetical protein